MKKYSSTYFNIDEIMMSKKSVLEDLKLKVRDHMLLDVKDYYFSSDEKEGK